MDALFHILSFAILVPVVITQTPESTEVSEGERATFTCIAVGRPLPNITWNGPQGEINNDENIDIDTHELPQSNAFLSVLNLKHISFFDTGVYNCTASNSAHGDLVPVDVDTHNFSVTVLSKLQYHHLHVSIYLSIYLSSVYISIYIFMYASVDLSI